MGGSNSPVGTLLLLGALALLVMMFLRQRRAQRDAASTQTSLTPGTEVMTTSGLYGTVVSIEDGIMTLETGPGQVSRWDKRAVARIVSPGATRTVQSEQDDAEDPSEGGDAERPGDEQAPPGRE